jgi:hypothetical protein
MVTALGRVAQERAEYLKRITDVNLSIAVLYTWISTVCNWYEKLCDEIITNKKMFCIKKMFNSFTKIQKTCINLSRTKELACAFHFLQTIQSSTYTKPCYVTLN